MQMLLLSRLRAVAIFSQPARHSPACPAATVGNRLYTHTSGDFSCRLMARYRHCSRQTSPNETMERIVSTTVHDLSVSATDMPLYSFTSQKPPSFRWENP